MLNAEERGEARWDGRTSRDAIREAIWAGFRRRAGTDPRSEDFRGEVDRSEAAEGAEYMVEGTSTFRQTGQSRYAQLHFRNEALTQVVGFTGDADTGAPREITPAQGDTFTISEK